MFHYCFLSKSTVSTALAKNDDKPKDEVKSPKSEVVIIANQTNKTRINDSHVGDECFDSLEYPPKVCSLDQ